MKPLFPTRHLGPLLPIGPSSTSLCLPRAPSRRGESFRFVCIAPTVSRASLSQLHFFIHVTFCSATASEEITSVTTKEKSPHCRSIQNARTCCVPSKAPQTVSFDYSCFQMEITSASPYHNLRLCQQKGSFPFYKGSFPFHNLDLRETGTNLFVVIVWPFHHVGTYSLRLTPYCPSMPVHAVR